MPKISEAQRQSRREQIARAAVAEFAVRGIHPTSMANIVAASGLSAGALYTHFSGKDEIIAYVARQTVGGVFQGLEGLLGAEVLPTPPELIAQITERISSAEVPTGFIVQVWAEAITNPSVHDAANEVYGGAFEFLRSYSARWLTERSEEGGLPEVGQTERQARVLLSLIYAHILQLSLLDAYRTDEFLRDITGGPAGWPGATPAAPGQPAVPPN
ncbi:Transcriptional regulator, TetR family [Leucobacter sp. 7(1)]|uniref:TetR/AcrR family transcriptional regulator n=1 Tax=Leucobacter sp. 7(1) TaxID=1255613 RepID=UPI00097E9C6A|nr:TetR/AcrR family transcriptional regulator [Leucobacter sp. 7(1)]SJN12900.1 Transcriptional regulator, TetR family [Leucobacter sp. 7(1)]